MRASRTHSWLTAVRRRLPVFLLAAWSAACASVQTAEPVGGVPLAIEAARVDGLWAQPERALRECEPDDRDNVGCLRVFVTDGALGRLAFVNEGGESRQAWLRCATPEAESCFLTWEDDADESGTRSLAWARARLDEDRLTLWLPRSSPFAELVAGGVLPGDVSASSGSQPAVRIESLDEAQIEVVVGYHRWQLFDWEHPVVLVRVPPR